MAVLQEGADGPRYACKISIYNRVTRFTTAWSISFAQADFRAGRFNRKTRRRRAFQSVCACRDENWKKHRLLL